MPPRKPGKRSRSHDDNRPTPSPSNTHNVASATIRDTTVAFGAGYGAPLMPFERRIGDPFPGDVWIEVLRNLPPRGILMPASLVSTALHVHSVEALTVLNVSNCEKITDAVVCKISKLTALTTLDVSYCGKITDAGVAEISKLTALTALNVSCCLIACARKCYL